MPHDNLMMRFSQGIDSVRFGVGLGESFVSYQHSNLVMGHLDIDHAMSAILVSQAATPKWQPFHKALFGTNDQENLYITYFIRTISKMCFAPQNQTTHTVVTCNQSFEVWRPGSVLFFWITVEDRTNEMLKAAAQLKSKEPAPAEAISSWETPQYWLFGRIKEYPKMYDDWIDLNIGYHWYYSFFLIHA